MQANTGPSLFVFFILGALVVEVGWAGAVGWGTFVASLPFQMFVGKKIGNARRKLQKAGDERVKFISELLTGIRVTKLYAWEIPLS